MTMTMALPKYLQNANRILTTLAEQPNKAWTKTQRELGDHLGFTQPELSSLLRLLREQEKIRSGAALPGVRGRNYVIELVDETLFTGPIQRHRASVAASQDRALTPEEELPSAVDLGQLTVDKIGAAIVRLLRDAWEKEERFNQLRTEHMTRLRQIRDQLEEERRLRSRATDEKEVLERTIASLEDERQRMRAEINKLIIKTNTGGNGSGGGYKMRDILPEDSLRALESLMRGRPGNYRESDAEVGLS